MNYDYVLFEQRGRVGIVTLNRPERLNAWSDAMMTDMRAAVEQCNADPSIGAVVFTGAGRAYCAGADISGFKRGVDARESGQAAGSGSATLGEENWITFLRRMPKPLIAAINGPAVGIGITHILPFDIRIASDSARIGMFFIRMGLVPELASSYYLAQLVGTGRALEWCLTGRMISAEEACSAGLISEVVPAERLLDRALEIGEQLAAQPAPAVRLIRQLFNQNATDMDFRAVMAREAEALAEAYATPEHREAVNAFLEKRAPDFSRR